MNIGKSQVFKAGPPGRPDVFASAISPDGTLVAFGTYDDVQLADLRTKEIGPVLHDVGTVLGFGTGGATFATIDLQGVVWRYDTHTNARSLFLKTDLKGHQSVVGPTVAISPDLQFVISHDNPRLTRIWGAGDSEKGRSLPDTTHDQCGIAFGPDGILAVSDSLKIQLWDLKTGQRKAEWEDRR